MSARFMPCDIGDHAIAAPAQSVSWLISWPNAGFAYLRATCHGAFRGDYVYRYLLVLEKGICHRWYIDGPEERWHLPPTEYQTPTSSGLLPSPAELLRRTPISWQGHGAPL